MKKTVLIIEDEQDIRHDLVRILELSGFNTIDANNGKIGLDLATSLKPDLIISDIMMNEMDGFELLKELQKSAETANIPFLILSAKSSRYDIRHGMKLGADDFITKPFDIDELLDAVNARLKKSEKIQRNYNRQIEEIRSSVRKSIPHEIRTPLNIILGMSDFLKKHFDNTSNSDAKEMLDNISESARRLHRLFENYLCYANLEVIATSEEEKTKLLSKYTPISEVFIRESVMLKIRDTNRANNIKLQLSDCHLSIAEDYLFKAIDEIIDNCLKFSDDDTPIEVSSYLQDGYCVLSFKDYGRGMSSEQINNIGAYVQFERKIYEQQGSGLGLTIVKRILDIHKGKFDINSQPGEFTEICLTIPVYNG